MSAVFNEALLRLPLLALSIAALLSVATLAQTPKPNKPISLAEQEDLRFEDAMRDFVFASGAICQCLPKAERTAHDRDVLTAFSGLVHVFGSDRAFYDAAAALGAGISMVIDKAKCATYIADFRAAMKSNAPAR